MPPMQTPVPIPTAPPSFIYSDARDPDPHDISKINLRKRIGHDLNHLDEDVQTSHDTTLSMHLNRSRVQRDSEGSMTNVRALAKEEFTRLSYSETSEHKRILDVVNSILVDVVRRQPWILDNIRKADGEHTPFAPPNASQNDEGIFSTSPQQLVVSGQRSNGRSEGGYQSAGAAHDGSKTDQSKEGTEGRGDTKPRQTYLNVSLTQPLRSESQISRENSPLYRRHPSTSQVVEDEKERDGSQLYALAQVTRSSSPGSQAHVQSSIPIAPEHSGSANSTGSPRSSTGLRHAGSLDPDQYRGSSFTHSDTKHLPVQNHYPIVSNIALCSRQDSVPLPFPHDTRQDRRINPGPWEIPWGSLHSHSFLDDFGFEIHRRLTGEDNSRLQLVPSDAPDGTHGQLNDKQLGAHHTEGSAKMREAVAQKMVAEAKRNEAEAKKRETEAHRKVDEARRRELEARQKEEMAKRNEEAARKREKEARRKEDDARRREDDARRRLEEAQQREMLARQREEEARHFEEKVRKEEEARRKEDAINRREEKEERKKPPVHEKATRHALGSSRHENNEVPREADDNARLEANKADTANRSPEVESTAAQHKDQSSAQVRAQTKWQRDWALEEQHRKQLEEQHRLEKQWYLEEKRHEEERNQLEREEQTRLEEELGREEKVSLDREALQTKSLTVAQANRLWKDQRRLTEEERYRILKEQHRKVDEQSLQRDQAPQRHQWGQKEFLRQRVKDEQKEFGRMVVEHYRLTTERERRNNTGAAFGRSAPHRLPGPTSAPAGNRAGVLSKPNPTLPNTRQQVPMPYTSAPKPKEEERIEVRGNRVESSGTKKGVSLAGSKLAEEERALRTEERDRQQQEQPEREQPERLGSERQTKNLNAKFAPEKRSADGARATGRSGNLGGIISRGLFQTFRR